MLLLFQSTLQAPTTNGINTSLVVGELYPPLNARGPGDLIFWSEDELFEWLDQAAKRLATELNLFVYYDTSITLASGTASYTVPTGHLVTLQADVEGVVLRARNVQELEALDDAWPATAGSPEAFLLDTEGSDKVTIYKKPGAAENGDTLGMIMAKLPTKLTKTAAVLRAPACVREYLTFYALGEARARESKAPMPEIAQWFRGLTGMLEQVIGEYWGLG